MRPEERSFWEAEFNSRLRRICHQSSPATGQRVQAETKACGGNECGESRNAMGGKNELDSQPMLGPWPPCPTPHRELVLALTLRVSSQERAVCLAQLMAASGTPVSAQIFPLRDKKKKRDDWIIPSGSRSLQS